MKVLSPVAVSIEKPALLTIRGGILFTVQVSTFRVDRKLRIHAKTSRKISSHSLRNYFRRSP